MEPVSLEQLRAAATTYDRAVSESEAAHAELVRLVRLADGNVPKTRIAAAIGKSRETVRKYCQG